MVFFRCLWWIDPDRSRDLRWFWWFAHEALGCADECGFESCLACSIDRLGLSEVDLIGGHESDARVMMFFVIPRKEPAAEVAGLPNGFKLLGKFRLILQRLEVGFRERVGVLLEFG